MKISYQIAFIFFSYLLGSIPFGYLLTKRFVGKNIMEEGSGNIGSTNVKRIAGKKISIITQLLDMFKGLLPVALFYIFIDKKIPAHDFLVYAIALSAIIGHDFSIFLKFKGGKGVNTTLGASFLIAPLPVLIAVAVYFFVRWRFKYVSLGSILLAITLPVSEVLISGLNLCFFYFLICMSLILLLHHENINRLLQKKELMA